MGALNTLQLTLLTPQLLIFSPLKKVPEGPSSKMTKLRKLRKKKTYNYGRNRKRVKQQLEKTSKFNVKVDCKVVRDACDHRISVRENMSRMGIVLNASDVMPVSGTKKKLVNNMKKLKNVAVEEETEAAANSAIMKPEVIAKLSEEANVPVKQNFRFTTSQVQLITHMMDNHGTDYKAMARDPRNHFQETPAKLKGMILKFISIPEHYAPYCKERGLLQTENSDGREDDLDSD